MPQIATSSPSANTGRNVCTSGRCWPPRNGSLVTMMSPGFHSPIGIACSSVVRSDRDIEFKWIGMRQDWAMIRPAGSNTAVE